MSFGLAGRGTDGCQGALKLQQFMPGRPKGQHSKQQLGFSWTSTGPDLTRGCHLSAVSPDKSLQKPVLFSSAKSGPSPSAPGLELTCDSSPLPWGP